jgi:hypothetical protein
MPMGSQYSAWCIHAEQSTDRCPTSLSRWCTTNMSRSFCLKLGDDAPSMLHCVSVSSDGGHGDSNQHILAHRSASFSIPIVIRLTV